MNQVIRKDISAGLKFTWVVLCVLSVTAWFWTFRDGIIHMVQVWGNSEAYKHCFFVPLISAYLVYEKRHQFGFEHIKPNYWLFLPLFALQIFYLVVAQLEINLFMHAAAVCSLILLLWALIGNIIGRILIFPLFYLIFAIPFGEELVPMLQDVTAELSVFFLELVGIPVYREGLYLYLPNGTFHVAEACAGVRFLIGTFTIGVLFSYINYTRYWKRLLFVLICAVLPVIANGIRAFGIMVIGYYSDMKYATGADHLVYGWFFFAFILVMLFYIGSIGTDKAITPDKPDSCSALNSRLVYSVFAVLLMVTLVAPKLLGDYALQFNSEPVDSHPFQHFSQSQVITELDAPSWVAPSQDRAWFGQWQDVQFRAIYVNEDTQNQELVSSRHRVFDNERWTQSSIETQTLGGKAVRVVKVVNLAGEQKILVAWYQVKGLQSINSLEVKWKQLLNRVEGGSNDGFFIVAEVPNLATAKQFMKAIAPEDE